MAPCTWYHTYYTCILDALHFLECRLYSNITHGLCKVDTERHMCDVRQIYRKISLYNTNVGLAPAHPNKINFNNIIVLDLSLYII